MISDDDDDDDDDDVLYNSHENTQKLRKSDSGAFRRVDSSTVIMRPSATAFHASGGPKKPYHFRCRCQNLRSFSKEKKTKHLLRTTLPETNVAPENRPPQ